MNSMKNKKVMIVSVIMLVIASILVIYFGFYMFSNPKTMLLQSVSKFKNDVENVTKKMNTEFSDKNGYNASHVLKINGEELYSLNSSIYENKKEKLASFDLELNQGDSNLINFYQIISGDKVYFKTKELDNYYYTDFEYFSALSGVENEISEKMLEYLYDSFKEVLTTKDIKSEKVKLELGEKEKKVTKLSYDIDGNNLYKVLNKTLDKVVNDKDMVDKILKAGNFSQSDFDDSIPEFRNKIKTLKEENILITYNVYYYGFNNIVMYELETSDYSVQLYDYDNINKIVLTNGKDSVIEVKVTEKKDNYIIDGKIGNYTFNGTYNEKNDNSTLVLNLNIEDLIIKLNVNITYKKDNIEVNSVVTALGNKIELNSNFKPINEKEIDTDSLKNSIDMNDLTDEDIGNILEKLNNNPLMALISKYIFDDGSDDTNIDTDIDSDYYDRFIVE